MASKAIARAAVIDSSEADTAASPSLPPTNPTSAAKAGAPVSQSEWVLQLKKTAAHWAVRFFALLAGLAFWQYASVTSLHLYVRFDNVPGPLQAGQALIQHLAESTFYMHIAVSLERIAISYALAAALGITLGLLMGRLQVVRDIVYPYIELLRPIPAVAWIPMAILLLPTEEGSIIFITFLGALFPIVLNTMHGVEQTPEVLIRAAQSLGASQPTIFRHVILPGALPSICAGLAIGMGVSWFSLLAGEIISGQYGIGYFTWNAYSIINYPDIVVGMLAIGLLGTSTTYLVQLLARPALAWQRKAR
ncbi:MAG TPA: ABC transporter permease [Pseudolabrys sp.]|nr:ABC transporter permease [Pseudolabrys sp.]